MIDEGAYIAGGCRPLKLGEVSNHVSVRVELAQDGSQTRFK